MFDGNRECLHWVWSASEGHADVYVDMDLRLVTAAYWEHAERPPGEQALRHGRDELCATAMSFLQQTALGLGGDKSPVYEHTHTEAGTQYCDFGWAGTVTRELVYWIKVEMSTATGRMVHYSTWIRGSDPGATAPVMLTEAQAAAAMREAVPKLRPDMGEFRVEVKGLGTRGPFALPGRPVYLVGVIGKTKGEHPHTLALAWGVDACDGRIYTDKDVHAPATMPQSATDLALTPSKSKEKAGAALPAGMTDAKLSVGKPTPWFWLAPLVPRSIRYDQREAVCPDGSGELWEWAQTWAVIRKLGRSMGCTRSTTSTPRRRCRPGPRWSRRSRARSVWGTLLPRRLVR